MRILLAGGNGYIGSNLLFRLEQQASITSINYSQGPNEKNFIKLDLTDVNLVNYYAENCDHFDVLIFLVGLAHSKGKMKDFPEFKKVNYQTLVNLLTALADNNKVPDKIIFASTISVYGEKYYQNTYEENAEKKPFSSYAFTKLEAEQYLSSLIPEDENKIRLFFKSMPFGVRKDNNNINDGTHRCCSMIGRLIKNQKYIPMYITYI